MRWIGVVAIVAVWTSTVRAQPPAIDSVPQLVRQLGDDLFARREAAGRGLRAVGEPALPALRKAEIGDESKEVRRRATLLIRAIMLDARKSKSTGLETTLIDPGAFWMGSPKTEGGRRLDEPEHKARITRFFLIGTFEVMQGEYEQVMKTNPSWFAKGAGGKEKVADLDTTRLPVESVTWFDAVEFCNRLGKLDGYQPYYALDDVKVEAGSIKSAKVTVKGGNGYRLPTEAEWEYACRAGTRTPFHFGYENTGKQANLKSGSTTQYASPPTWPTLGRTAKVGAYDANQWGLHDMHGNVAEWTGDWYDRNYTDLPENDPTGPAEGAQRVLRGGSWMVVESSCRAASRHPLAPGEATNYAGFRVARTP